MRTIDAIVDDLLENIALNPIPFLVYRFQLNTEHIIDAELLIDELERAMQAEATSTASQTLIQDIEALKELLGLARHHLKLLPLFLGYSNFSHNIAVIQLKPIKPGNKPEHPKLQQFFSSTVSAIYNLHGILAVKAKVQVADSSTQLQYAEAMFDKAYEHAPTNSFAEKVISANILLLIGSNLQSDDIPDITTELSGFIEHIDESTLDKQQKISVACLCDSIAVSSASKDLKFAQKNALQQRAFKLWHQCPAISHNLAMLLYSQRKPSMDQVCSAIEIYNKIANQDSPLIIEICIHHMCSIGLLAKMQIKSLNQLRQETEEGKKEFTQCARRLQETIYSLCNASKRAKELLGQHSSLQHQRAIQQFARTVTQTENFIDEVKGPLHFILNPNQYVREAPADSLLLSFSTFMQRNKYSIFATIGALGSWAAYNYNQVMEQQSARMSLNG